MFKLYKREADRRLLYHEAWSAGAQVVEHWGVCGDRGETKAHPVADDREARRALQQLKKAAAARGYASIPESRMKMLVVEYPLDGWGSPSDLQRRHALEDGFNELIGWMGLGHLDGGSIGSGSMEIALMVVDFEIAKSALEAGVAGTPLEGFSSIRRE